MAGNTVVTVGDTSSHGGTVISGSPDMTVNGKQMSRVGDQHSCPISGHGVTAIVSSPTVATADGQIIAVTGAVAGCGAVITGSNTGFTA